MSATTTRGARPTHRTPRDNSIRRQVTTEARHASYADLERVVVLDPHGVTCPTCGARPFEPCTWTRKPKLLTVHSRRSSRWFRNVLPLLDARQWIEYPEVETPAALAARRAVMRDRYCTDRRIADHLLRRFGLDRAIVDTVPCDCEGAA